MRRKYYEILGVDSMASGSEIRKAYMRLSIRLHPDKQLGSTEEELEVMPYFLRLTSYATFPTPHFLHLTSDTLLPTPHFLRRTSYRRQLRPSNASRQRTTS